MNRPTHNELEEVNRKVNRWEAGWRGLFWLAAVASVLWALSLGDFVFRYGRTGRLVAWAILLATAGAALAHLAVTLRRRRTDNAVAALIEHAFPDLDNRLINCVQFAAEPVQGQLTSAYLRQGVPQWGALDLRALRDRRAGRRAALAGAGALLLLALPCAWAGSAWSIAVIRVLNPFSDRMPPTLAKLIDVQPGNSVIVQGSPLAISCRASGHKGQKVELDLWPADDRHIVALLGSLSGGGAETFTYRLPKATSDLGYRVRAGDAMPSERFRIAVVPPLAFQSLRLRIEPQPYTRLPTTEVDGLTGRTIVPQNARVDLRLRCNRPLRSASWGVDEGTPAALTSADAHVNWSGSLLVGSGQVFRVAATDQADMCVKTDLRFELLPDRPPTIRVIAPAGKTVLTAGAAPGIQFEVADDYGVDRVELRRMNPADAEGTNGTVVKEWTKAGERNMAEAWTGSADDLVAAVSYRLVATDNMQPGDPHRVLSAPIDFEPAQAGVIVQQQQLVIAAAAASLTSLVDLQRANLKTTTVLNETAAPESWAEVLATQKRIRQLAADLLANPRCPLGTLTANLKRAYDEPMAQVIDVLERACKSEGAGRAMLSGQAVDLESAILRMLSQIDAAMGQVRQHQAATGLLALIEALVNGQRSALEQTLESQRAGGTVPDTLVRRQDKLAGDVAEFVLACRDDSQRSETADVSFAKLVRQAADMADSKRIRADMLTAAEKLEGGRAAEAVPPATQALQGLTEIQKLLNEWRVQDAAEKAQQIKEAIEASKAALAKLAALQAKVVDAVRATETQKDKTGGDRALLAEENKELKAEMKEAALKIANDLQALPELPVGNELVEDLNQIYEKMKQIAGSESTPATELGLQKEDWLLAGLAAAEKRMDSMEMWLAAAPDAVKRNTETFDKQELPKIGLISMPKELDDIIGDLQKQEEDIQKKSDDSTGNQGSADMPPGWAIAEGEFTDYSAQGKSGNEAPEHKDQDGRSAVGREGMADGEVVGASGKINEGDKNIDKRMTRDSSQGGQVQEEGQAEAKATGGGKLSGTAAEQGMSGQGPRRDAAATAPSEAGAQAMLRRSAEAVYAQASLLHIRSGALDQAIQHMRQAEDALARGMPIRQVREFQRRAIVALKETHTELSSGFAEGSLAAPDTVADRRMDDLTASTPDEAPVRYRDLVSDYFKVLSEEK